MTNETGTAAELNLQVGDVVTWAGGFYNAIVDENLLAYAEINSAEIFTVISRAKHKDDLTFDEMSDAQKIELVQGELDGKRFKYWSAASGVWLDKSLYSWFNHFKYRAKPAEPVVVEVEVYVSKSEHSYSQRLNASTHSITYNTIDGEPDCDSIKMEEL